MLSGKTFWKNMKRTSRTSIQCETKLALHTTNDKTSNHLQFGTNLSKTKLLFCLYCGSDDDCDDDDCNGAN